MLVVKQQTERKSANHQVTTPSIKPDCVETNLPFDLNSALPVGIDHPSIRTSDTALPSDEVFEPPSAMEKAPTTHAIQVDDGDKENGFLTATSATKEPALAVEILLDSDFLEIHEDGDLGTVVLVDKGKGVDPREYGGALYDSNSMMVPAGTTSTGRSDSIELVGIHQDKGNNVDPEERGNEMAKDEPGPSQIDFHDDSDSDSDVDFFQEKMILLRAFERTRTTDGLPYDLTLPRLAWHPKISPYRFIVSQFRLPLGQSKLY